MRKVLAFAAAGLLALSVGGGALAAAAAPAEPAKSYGGCVSKSTGYLRVLERNNLPKSVQGACKSTERKITWYSRSGVPFPSRLVFKRSSGTETCTKDTAISTSGTWVFGCVTATPSPSPSPAS